MGNREDGVYKRVKWKEIRSRGKKDERKIVGKCEKEVRE